MKSIEEFFGKSPSKISKPLKQKFNIYSKYENRMNPKDFETLGKKLFNRELKGSPQSLAQALSPNSIGNVKSRYGEKYSIKASSKSEKQSLKTTINNWTRLPDFPQSQGQHHRFYTNSVNHQVLINYRNEGRSPKYVLYNDVKKPTIETLRHRVFRNITRTNEDFEKTKDINSWSMKALRDVNSAGIEVAKPNWLPKVKLDSGKDIKAPYFTQKSVAKRNMKILTNNNK